MFQISHGLLGSKNIFGWAGSSKINQFLKEFIWNRIAELSHFDLMISAIAKVIDVVDDFNIIVDKKHLEAAMRFHHCMVFVRPPSEWAGGLYLLVDGERFSHATGKFWQAKVSEFV